MTPDAASRAEYPLAEGSRPASAEGLERLRALREEIVALQIVRCRMMHERVIRDSGSGLPLLRRFPEGEFKRVSLCAPEVRVSRLGCSHTSARILLGDAIRAMSSRLGANNPSISEFSRVLSHLDNELHLLDHRKGDAEKVLAARLMATAGQRDGDVKEAEDEIREMEATHDDLVARIGHLRDLVVHEMDKLLMECEAA